MIALADKLQFQDFIRAAARRTGQILNIHDTNQDVGVSDNTTKRQLHPLEIKRSVNPEKFDYTLTDEIHMTEGRKLQYALRFF